MNYNERKSKVWPWFLIMFSCGSGIGYFVVLEDHVTAIALTAIVVSALCGYWMKASRLVLFYCGLAVACLTVPHLSPYVEPRLAEWFGMSALASHLVSMISIGFLIAIAIAWLGHRIGKKILPERRSLESVNRLSGFAIGGIQGAMLVLVVAAGLLVIEPFAKKRLAADVEGNDHKVARVVSKRVIDFSGRIRASAIGPITAKYDPFQHIPEFKQFESQLNALAIPLTKPASKSETAIDELRAD